MFIDYLLKVSKTILLTLLLFSIIGCGHISAKSVQPKAVAGYVPAQTAPVLQNQNTNNESSSDAVNASAKEETETKDAAGSRIAEKAEEKNNNVQTEKREYSYRNGNPYLKKYQKDSLVKQIILIEQSATTVSSGRLYALTKDEEGNWQEFLQCKAYLGKNGIDKTREGDVRTPTGDFGMTMAFGAKEDPGSIVPYTKLTNTMYLCGDREYYNQFIDISKVNHTCSGNSEHLLSYVPQYNYALFFDYNKENVYGKGSAIFLHCFGNYPFTMGCIAVAEENMVKILQTVDTHARICIYPGE